MRDKVKDDASTKHVDVIVTEVAGGFSAEYDPKVISVGQHNTVIKFRLVTPTPDDVVIDSVAITPAGQTQLSNPVISSNGKHMELTDANTVKESFHLAFSYRSKKQAAQRALKQEEYEVEVDYPIIDNNPP